MNADLGKTLFTPEEIDDLRDRLKAYKADNKLSWNDLQQVVDVPAGTLSGWVPGNYNNGKIHENQDIPGRVHRFFLALTERAQLAATMPPAPDFVETESARRILTCLALAHQGDMALVSAEPGCGKTAAVKQYAATRGKVYTVACAPSTRGVNNLLVAILNAMGVKDARGTPQLLSAQIRARVKDGGALIVADEAQHLSPQALDELRSIHDDTECGVALVGDMNLHANLKKYPQLYSRLGVRHVQSRPTPADVTIIAGAWGITKGAELAFLQDIGRKPGGIRTLTKTVRLAVRSARMGGAPLEIADLRDAYAQRYGEGA